GSLNLVRGGWEKICRQKFYDRRREPIASRDPWREMRESKRNEGGGGGGGGLGREVRLRRRRGGRAGSELPAVSPGAGGEARTESSESARRRFLKG
ncbi:hypothetical protein CRG98_031100, partial [Punica granatum]